MVMIRLIEPKRPAGYKSLPRYERADYWHTMYRAIRVKSEDLIEIDHFTGQRMRVVGFLLFLLTLIPLIGGPIYSYGSWGAFADEVADDFEYVFDFEDLIRRQYQRDIERGLFADRTEEEYLESFQNNPIHQNRFLSEFLGPLLLFSMPLICLGIALFWPQACPVRCDRKREVIYTWHKNRLYVADIGPMLGGLKTKLTSEADGSPMYHHDQSTGALGLEMMPVDGSGPMQLVRVGPYPPCHAYQNKDIHMFISAFMASHLYDENGHRYPWNSAWLSKVERGRFFALDPLRWLGARTLGRKHRFDEAKTEDVLLGYLTKPDTRSRGEPHWRRPV